MTKTLEQIQEENRKAIILANNSEAKSYEEALEMELDRGCKIIVWSLLGDTNMEIRDYIRPENLASFPGLDGYFELADNPYVEESILGKKELKKFELKEIIGKPLTLDRVLIALNKTKQVGFDCNGYFIDPVGFEHTGYAWDLTKPTLEEQTEETQRKINELLTKN